MFVRAGRGVLRWMLLVVALACSPDGAAAETSVIPLPEIIVDPNEGTTVGFLPVVLIADEQTKSIRSIFAPDVRYNDITGVYPTVRFYDYPDPKQKYFVVAGKGSNRGEYIEGNFVGLDVLQGWLDVQANVRHEQDPFERFYGFGNDTPRSNETNWTSTTESALLFAGVNLPESLQASLQTRLRHVRVARGGVNSVTQLRDPSSGFSTVNGVQGASIVGERFGLAYDTRDVTDIPTEGVFANTGVEVVDKAIGSSNSFVKYDFEGKGYFPVRRDKKLIVAVHAVLDYLEHGSDAPFYEKYSVGGVHTLRAYGSNRFTDNNRFVLQGELRSNVYEREIFGVRAHLEVAPFIDLARVFHRPSVAPVEDLHAVGGVGFRAVVVPQVVAYVDFGSAGSGVAAYTGIDYPF